MNLDVLNLVITTIECMWTSNLPTLRHSRAIPPGSICIQTSVTYVLRWPEKIISLHNCSDCLSKDSETASDSVEYCFYIKKTNINVCVACTFMLIISLCMHIYIYTQVYWLRPNLQPLNRFKTTRPVSKLAVVQNLEATVYPFKIMQPTVQTIDTGFPVQASTSLVSTQPAPVSANKLATYYCTCVHQWFLKPTILYKPVSKPST